MNSGSDRSPTTCFSAIGSCQAGDSISSRTGESPQPLLTTHASRVTVQPLTKKRKISWRPLKIEYQLLPPIPWPLPPARRGGKGNFFLWVFAGGLRPPAKTLFFLPLPNGVCAVGEGAGGGAKATGHKGSSIAVWHPGARLNSHRTFSFLDGVHQRMASPL